MATTWKHLHSVLFKKVRVPYAADMWSQSASVSQPSASEADDPVDGIPMVVSEEFVALQVKNLIERREKWLRDNRLPLNTVMDDPQKEKFWRNSKPSTTALKTSCKRALRCQRVSQQSRLRPLRTNLP